MTNDFESLYGISATNKNGADNNFDMCSKTHPLKINVGAIEYITAATGINTRTSKLAS